MRSLEPVREYGCRVHTPEERAAIYEHRRGQIDETLCTRIAIGIKVKAKWLEHLRMVPKHRALVVIPQPQADRKVVSIRRKRAA